MPTFVLLFVLRINVHPLGGVIVELLPPLTVTPATSTSFVATDAGFVSVRLAGLLGLPFCADEAEPNVMEPPPEAVLAPVRFEELLEPPPIVEALVAPLRSEELLGPAAIEALAAPVRSDE